MNNQQFYFIPVSGNNPQELFQHLHHHLSQLQHADEHLIGDLSYKWSFQSSHASYRLAATGTSGSEISEQLEAKRSQLMLTQAAPDMAEQLIFVFPDQGVQWLHLGRRLFANDETFRLSIKQSERVLSPCLGWSLSALMDGCAEVAFTIDRLPPVIFAIQLALVVLWKSWGIEPAAVVGCGIGEVAAAYVAGQLTLRDAAQVIAWRSQIAHICSERGIQPHSLLEQESVALLQYVPDIVLTDLHPRPGHLRCFRLTDPNPCQTSSPDSTVWLQTLRKSTPAKPQFAQFVQAGYRHFVEISADPVFTPSIGATLRRSNLSVGAGSARHSAMESEAEILKNLCDFYMAGHPITWRRLWSGCSTSHTCAHESGAPAEKTVVQPAALQNQLLQSAIIYRAQIIEAYLREQVGRMLHMPGHALGVDIPLSQLGFDSLMVTEFSRRLEQRLELPLLGTAIWRYPTITALVPFIAEQLGVEIHAKDSDGLSTFAG